MSSDAQPITPARFAAALRDLTVGSIYAKAAELQNSIAHLRRSNEEMRPFMGGEGLGSGGHNGTGGEGRGSDGHSGTGGDRADPDFAEYIWENLAVIGRQEERLGLLRAEIEARGLPWHPEIGLGQDNVEPGEIQPGRLSPPLPPPPPPPPLPLGQEVSSAGAQAVHSNSTGGGAASGGSLDDTELARRMAERLREQGSGDDDDDNDEGVHL